MDYELETVTTAGMDDIDLLDSGFYPEDEQDFDLDELGQELDEMDERVDELVFD